jgi:hypothetical protein
LYSSLSVSVFVFSFAFKFQRFSFLVFQLFSQRLTPSPAHDKPTSRFSRACKETGEKADADAETD